MVCEFFPNCCRLRWLHLFCTSFRYLKVLVYHIDISIRIISKFCYRSWAGLAWGPSATMGSPYMKLTPLGLFLFLYLSCAVPCGVRLILLIVSKLRVNWFRGGKQLHFIFWVVPELNTARFVVVVFFNNLSSSLKYLLVMGLIIWLKWFWLNYLQKRVRL